MLSMKRPVVHQYPPYQPPPTTAAISPAASASWRKLLRRPPFAGCATIAGAEICRSAGSDPGRSAGGAFSRTSATAVVPMGLLRCCWFGCAQARARAGACALSLLLYRGAGTALESLPDMARRAAS